MKLRTLVTCLALTLSGPAFSEEATQDDTSAQRQSQFVGQYNGSSFETAMGMVIRADGTFQWGLSVGSLDMRAQGTWIEEGDTIIFASDPKPVPPEFVWSGVEREEGGPLLHVVWASNGEPFRYASVRGACANGAAVFGYLDEGHWSPGEECDQLVRLEFRMQSYDLRSKVFELSGEREVEKDETIRFEFHRNDLGVANFDGVVGRLEDGKLHVQSRLGEMTLRKLTEPTE
jgi:hypothetical protein